MRKNITFIVVIVALSVVAIVVARLLATRTAHDQRITQPAEGTQNLHEHGESCEHDHIADEGAGDLAMSMDEVLSAGCEHGTATHLCSDCRYEVGVVRVDNSLRAGGEKSGDSLVRVTAASKGVVRSDLDVTGEVRLNENRTVHVRPRIAGIVNSVSVDVGAAVDRGDVLFETVSAELGRVLSEHERNRAMADMARRNYEREESLYERKISSELDLMEAGMTYEQYQAELKATEWELRALGMTEQDISRVENGTGGGAVSSLPIRAPMDGTIVYKHASVGELVDPSEDVMILSDLRTVWVWADIYERDLAALIEARAEGPVPLEVYVHAFPGRAFPGKIDYVGAVMEERTRTVKVRAIVENNELLLRPGMFCEVVMRLDKIRETLSVPKVSLLSDDGQQFVFKHLVEDLFVRRAVKTGRESGESVEILEGLEPGEIIVADGAFLLKSDVLRSKMGAG